jgi:hypothetical protein
MTVLRLQADKGSSGPRGLHSSVLYPALIASQQLPLTMTTSVICVHTQTASQACAYAVLYTTISSAGPSSGWPVFDSIRLIAAFFSCALPAHLINTSDLTRHHLLFLYLPTQSARHRDSSGDLFPSCECMCFSTSLSLLFSSASVPKTPYVLALDWIFSRLARMVFIHDLDCQTRS